MRKFVCKGCGLVRYSAADQGEPCERCRSEFEERPLLNCSICEKNPATPIMNACESCVTRLAQGGGVERALREIMRELRGKVAPMETALAYYANPEAWHRRYIRPKGHEEVGFLQPSPILAQEALAGTLKVAEEDVLSAVAAENQAAALNAGQFADRFHDFCAETMDIYSPKGTKVVFTGKNGYDHERENACTLLKIGDTYTVERTEVGQSHTTVFLQEQSAIGFNSVHFTPAPEYIDLLGDLGPALDYLLKGGRVQRLRWVKCSSTILAFVAPVMTGYGPTEIVAIPRDELRQAFYELVKEKLAERERDDGGE